MKDIKELIPEADAFKALTLKDLPALKGTEKQVEWAKKIRHEIILQLFNEATSKDANGRPNALCKIGIRGKDFAQADIEAYASQFDDELVNEKVEQRVRAFNTVAQRIARYNEIALHDDAKFWIDNRTNQAANFMNKKLLAEINVLVK